MFIIGFITLILAASALSVAMAETTIEAAREQVDTL